MLSQKKDYVCMFLINLVVFRYEGFLKHSIWFQVQDVTTPKNDLIALYLDLEAFHCSLWSRKSNNSL